MTNQLTLFVEINEKNFIFVAGKYDESQNFEIANKIITPVMELVITNSQILK